MEHTSQAALVSDLVAIFPDFQRCWDADNDIDDMFRGGSLHSVYRSFLPFVTRAAPSEKQIKKLAAVLNEAVAAGSDAENAVATCFFEGLGRGPLLRALRPLLTREAEARLHP